MVLAKTHRVLIPALALLTIGGCARLSQVGKEPQISQIENPATQYEQRLVTVPLPEPTSFVREPGSLWTGGTQRSFFRDQRARDVGDILTVVVAIDDEAELENETSRTRTTAEETDLSGLLGFEGELANLLPDAFTPEAAIDIEGGSTAIGEGEIEREEEIDLLIAAMITQKLPNGNFVIAGRQEVRVNYELRELRVAGIIRPEDITAGNTIAHSQIAELRMAYGGRGQLSDVQQPRYGQQVLDVLLPF